MIALTRHCTAAAAVLSLAACASLPPGAAYPRIESHAIAPQDGKYTRAFKNPGTAQADVSGFRMLSVGIDGLTARLELIESAERSLDLQYYIFHLDISGSLVAQALLRAADRGVRVRVLIDDGETVKGDEMLMAMAAHPQVEVRVFNPFDSRGHNKLVRGLDFISHKSRLDYRMHNKLIVADNAVAMIGGRNIGDQYFQIDPGSQFGDDDVVAAGPIVQSLSGVFDQFWNDRQSIPARAIDPAHSTGDALARLRAHLPAPGAHGPFQQSQFEKDLAQRMDAGEPMAGMLTGRTPMIWAPSRLLYDSPDKHRVVDGEEAGQLIYKPLDEQTNAAGRELLMVTPYFIPSSEEMQTLARARERNVSVRLLTNSLEAAPDLVAHAGYTHFRARLLGDGVQVHEIRATLGSASGSGGSKRRRNLANYGLHAKLYVFDRHSLFVGSMNFDQRSKRLNTEIGLIISSEALAKEVAARFEALTQPSNSYRVEMQDAGPVAHRRLVWNTEEAGVCRIYLNEPARSSWQRMETKAMSLLPIDSEL